MTGRGVFRVAVIATPLVAIAGLLCFCAFVFSLADKTFDVRRGSFGYYALLGSTIRNVPLIEAEGEPTFRFRGGDGPKPTEAEIAYVSRAEAARLEAEIARYLEARGYKRRANTNPPPAEQFASGSVYFVIVTKPEGATTKVWVTKAEF